jgi:hypothetical protein
MRDETEAVDPGADIEVDAAICGARTGRHTVRIRIGDREAIVTSGEAREGDAALMKVLERIETPPEAITQAL